MTSLHSTRKVDVTGKAPISIKLSDELLTAIDTIAAEDDRSRNATVRLALAQYVRYREKGISFKHRKKGPLETGDRKFYKKRTKKEAPANG